MRTITSIHRLIAQHLTFARLLPLLSCISTALLGTALVGQYGFGLHPCHLCLYQRYPYAAIIALGAAGFFIRNPRLQLAIAVACIALFALDAGIASYHAGVEAGIFPGPSGCTSSGKTGQTLEELRAEILNAPLVTCDQAMVYVLGLSMAAWNAIAAAVMSIVSLIFVHLLRKGHPL